MSFKHVYAADGSMRLVDNVSGRTIQKHYPGNSVSGGRTKILAAASTLTEADNGTIFFINHATGFATTLPTPFLGAEFTFISKTANTSGNHTIVSSSSANIIKGLQNSVAGDAGDSGTADDTISFVANQSLPGDIVRLISDGTSWFAHAISKVAAGITFTQAST